LIIISNLIFKKYSCTYEVRFPAYRQAGKFQRMNVKKFLSRYARPKNFSE